MPAGRTAVRAYQPGDETGWLRCRVVAFLDSAYYDDVSREKERYESRAIELVAEYDDQIAGLIDVECEDEPGAICSEPADSGQAGLAGMIWHLAVHPDYRRQGIGRCLLEAAAERARVWQIRRFEAWTRDDEAANSWYRAQGFRLVQSYYHVYMDGDETHDAVQVRVTGLRLKSVFAHYLGNDEQVVGRYKRVHTCNRYDLRL